MQIRYLTHFLWAWIFWIGASWAAQASVCDDGGFSLFSDKPKCIEGVAHTAIVPIASPLELQIIAARRIYVPSGTRLLVTMSDEYRDLESARRLALTNTGYWIWIDDDEYTVKKPSDGKKSAPTVILNDSTQVDLESGLSIVLPPNQPIPLAEEYDGFGDYILSLDRSVFAELRSSPKITVEVERSRGQIITDDQCNEGEVSVLTRASITDGVFGYTKSCGQKRIDRTAYSAAAAAKFNIKAIGISGETKKRLELSQDHDVNEDVAERYYTWTDGEKAFKVTTVRGCPNQENENQYYFTVHEDGKESVFITENGLTSAGVPVDKNTKRPLISCAEQYQSFVKFLSDQIATRNIPFIIALTSRWIDTSDLGNCEN